MTAPSMRTGRTLTFVLAAGIAVAGSVSCQGDFIGDVRNAPHLQVRLCPATGDCSFDAPVAGVDVTGTRDAPRPLQVEIPIPFRVVVRAIRASGSVDDTFTGYVRLSSKPGALAPLTTQDTSGRNVLLTNGVSDPVDVQLANAYGTTFIVADDLGYIPVDPLRDPPPACADGVDNDRDGKIDFPADEGCAFANDDAEQGSSYAEGVSEAIYFAQPRIADARGLVCLPELGCSSNGATPYPKQSIQLDTGFRTTDDGRPKFIFDTVVTRISSDGFYASDTGDVRGVIGGQGGGFNNLFVFNFSAPSRMRICDRLKALNGTAAEFFGFTQLSYPTWVVEEWDPRARRCLVPTPEVLSPGDVGDKAFLLRTSGALVRVESANGVTVRVTPHFGPGDMQQQGGVFTPTADATNCDLNKNGKLEFDATSPEKACSDACTNDPECTEYSNYAGRSTFRLTVGDTGGQLGAIQADASSSGSFDPVASKGQTIRAFSGVLTYFSGGSQFTIEARCEDDIVTDMNKAPFGTDDRTDLSLPPPPIACALPRTDLELNPQ